MPRLRCVHCIKASATDMSMLSWARQVQQGRVINRHAKHGRAECLVAMSSTASHRQRPHLFQGVKPCYADAGQALTMPWYCVLDRRHTHGAGPAAPQPEAQRQRAWLLAQALSCKGDAGVRQLQCQAWLPFMSSREPCDRLCRRWGASCVLPYSFYGCIGVC